MKGKNAAAGSILIMMMMASILPSVIADARRGMRAAGPAPGLQAPARPVAAAYLFVGPRLRAAGPGAAAPAPAAPAPAAPLSPDNSGLLVKRAIEKGVVELSNDPDLWNRVQLGKVPEGLRLDLSYEEPHLPGAYVVGLSSGPLFGQVTITGVARGPAGRVRAASAVYDYLPQSLPREIACRWDEASPRCP